MGDATSAHCTPVSPWPSASGCNQCHGSRVCLWPTGTPFSSPIPAACCCCCQTTPCSQRWPSSMTQTGRPLTRQRVNTPNSMQCDGSGSTKPCMCRRLCCAVRLVCAQSSCRRHAGGPAVQQEQQPRPSRQDLACPSPTRPAVMLAP